MIIDNGIVVMIKYAVANQEAAHVYQSQRKRSLSVSVNCGEPSPGQTNPAKGALHPGETGSATCHGYNGYPGAIAGPFRQERATGGRIPAGADGSQEGETDRAGSGLQPVMAEDGYSDSNPRPSSGSAVRIPGGAGHLPGRAASLV